MTIKSIYIPREERAVLFGEIPNLTNERIREIFASRGLKAVKVERTNTCVVVHFDQSRYHMVYEAINDILAESAKPSSL